MSPHARTTRDARAIEIAAATERALQAHEQTCRAREERRQDQAAEFRDELRTGLAELRPGLREVGPAFERLQSRSMPALRSAVGRLLGPRGWLAAKRLSWEGPRPGA